MYTPAHVYDGKGHSVHIYIDSGDIVMCMYTFTLWGIDFNKLSFIKYRRYSGTSIKRTPLDQQCLFLRD